MLKVSVAIGLLVTTAALALADATTIASSPRAADNATAPSTQNYTEAQVALVAGWIRTQFPEVSGDVVGNASRKFLESVSVTRPEWITQLGTDTRKLDPYQSEILRQIGLQLTAPNQAMLREKMAERRVQVALTSMGESGVTAETAVAVISRMRETSPVYERRLLEGRVEDDDLLPLVKRARETSAGAPTVGATPSHVLTANDILSEYSRHNQIGSAADHLDAYTISATLTTAKGTEQKLVLLKMRPDRFKIIVLSDGVNTLSVAYDGKRFWQRSGNEKPTEIAVNAIGAKRYFAEFLNPLLDPEKYSFERLADGKVSGQSVYRIEVTRPDTTNYVSCIDMEKFREVSHENDNDLTILYSDFRDLGGVTIPFREDLSDGKARRSSFTIDEAKANPGLIQAIFEPRRVGNPEISELQGALAQTPLTSGKNK